MILEDLSDEFGRRHRNRILSGNHRIHEDAVQVGEQAARLGNSVVHLQSKNIDVDYGNAVP